MSDLRSLPPDLQQRYGVRGRSVVGMVVAGLLAAVLAIASGWTAWTLANPPVRSKLLTWSVPADDHTRVTFEVNKEPADTVYCVVRVADDKRHDVGYAVITVPPGQDYEQPTYDIRTRAAGRIVELLGCEAGEVPVVPAPEFPPGTENPPQPWTPEETT